MRCVVANRGAVDRLEQGAPGDYVTIFGGDFEMLRNGGKGQCLFAYHNAFPYDYHD